MKFQKLGVLKPFTTVGYSGSQAPTVVVMKDRIRVYFSARDLSSRSHCFFYDLSRENPLEVINTCTESIIPLGKLGSGNDSGCMVSYVHDNYYLFVGWNKGNGLVRYRTCSMTMDRSTGKQEMLHDRGEGFPAGCSMPFLDPFGDLWMMGYQYWDIDTKEPYYSIIKQKPLQDGVFTEVVGIDNSTGGAARPVVVELNSKIFTLYSKRGKQHYRTSHQEFYRMYYREVLDKEWWVDPENLSPETRLEIEGCPETEMQAYGYPFQVDKEVYMLHNSNFTSPLVLSKLVK